MWKPENKLKLNYRKYSKNYLAVLIAIINLAIINREIRIIYEWQIGKNIVINH